MSQMHKGLAGLLLLQLVLAGITWTTCGTHSAESGRQPLLDLEQDAVRWIAVQSIPSSTEHEPRRVELEREGDDWTLASVDGYPAESSKVEGILGKLLGLEVRDVIAENSGNHNALKVGDEEYDRRVTLRTADGVHTLVLGSGTGSSVYVRLEDDSKVYRTKGLSVWDLDTGPTRYIDAQLVDVDRDKLTRVALHNPRGSLTFEKRDGEWSLAELPRRAELDRDKVRTFLGQVGRISIHEPAGRGAKPEYGLDGRTRVELSYQDGEETRRLQYEIGAKKGESHYYARKQDSEFVVTVSKWNVDELLEKRVKDFARKKG